MSNVQTPAAVAPSAVTDDASKTPCTRRAASYARTGDVDPNKLKRQHEANRATASRDGFGGPDGAFACWEDAGYSGVDPLRPGLTALLAHVESGPPAFSRLYVADPTRLCRSDSLTATWELIMRFEQCGVDVVFTNAPGPTELSLALDRLLTGSASSVRRRSRAAN